MLTVVEVARELRLSERQVRRMVARGELPSVTIGRARRVRRDELVRWVDDARR
jgi:excisionase family DNA binding protein